jgi:5-methylcytosine-specific restriction endonuclease McrA
MPKNKRTLVLNANFLPLGLISWKRAITLSILHQEDSNSGVSIIDNYQDDYITDSKGRRYDVPAVVRSIKFIKQKQKKIPFSRKNIFIRDQMQCQYCGKRFPIEQLTYDHVIPRAKWKRQNHSNGPTHWNNIVTSCVPCNRRKANRTPQEADMSLIKPPCQPNPHGFILGLAPWAVIPKEWEIYLTSIYKNIFNNHA